MHLWDEEEEEVGEVDEVEVEEVEKREVYGINLHFAVEKEVATDLSCRG